ncbi:MAG: DUF2062 domain-containing protein [Paracoccaceae bacterium]
MVFKRRTPRSWLRAFVEFFYPRGGWQRAAQYVVHRVRRLPDEPHRIGRGVFAGVFISFTPLFGFHFLFAAGIAWVIRGNILAALLATFFGNPLTTPVIAWSAVELGHLILGSDRAISLDEIVTAFSGATTELWRNILAMFGPGVTHWSALGGFFDAIFLPYLVGGIVPGVICAAVCHHATLPLVEAYKKRRKKKLRDRVEKLRAQAAVRARADGATGGPA